MIELTQLKFLQTYFMYSGTTANFVKYLRDLEGLDILPFPEDAIDMETGTVEPNYFIAATRISGNDMAADILENRFEMERD